jgi:hypothetical protein
VLELDNFTERHSKKNERLERREKSSVDECADSPQFPAPPLDWLRPPVSTTESSMSDSDKPPTPDSKAATVPLIEEITLDCYKSISNEVSAYPIFTNSTTRSKGFQSVLNIFGALHKLRYPIFAFLTPLPSVTCSAEFSWLR